jgi:predicted methyltransferase
MTKSLDYPLITIKEAEMILSSYESGEKTGKISLDLGISMTDFVFDKSKVHIKDEIVDIDEFRKIKENFCYALEDGELKKMAFFSDDTKFYYKLYPTKDWPTMMFSSTPMHRYSKVSPKEDTLAKIKDITDVSPIKGSVLDTCCGLGYTAICAADHAKEVRTFERDENVIYLEAINPYSRRLFTDKRIKHNHANVYDEIWTMKDNYFDIIIHDPPTPKYSSLLYSKDFYGELFRIMKNGAVLYHYAPWPHKTRGEDFPKNISKNLEKCGFIVLGYKQSSSGIIAKKP